jgi:hypothetical protein
MAQVVEFLLSNCEALSSNHQKTQNFITGHSGSHL